jgi:two-component system chemotaxis response regulator CheB
MPERHFIVAFPGNHARTGRGTTTDVIGYGRTTTVQDAVSSSRRAPPRFDLVVVAASAGGLAALVGVLATLPRDFPLPIAVVQHVDPNRPSLLAGLLARRTALQVKQAELHDRLSPGVVYIAPPAQHMIITASRTIGLNRSEPVHFLRPCADRLFQSAADSCGRVLAVILSGTGTDGASGAAAIKAAGGLVIAQDEASSAFFGMPHAAIEAGVVDRVLGLDAIGPAIADILRSDPR